MKRIWAPWRLEYVTGPREEGGCVFCEALREREQERQRHVLYRDEHAFIMLNRFPYNNGHLLLSPVAHVGDLEELPLDVFLHLGELLRASIGVLREAYRPEGMNLGMNLGSCAGAGVPGHLHWHLVPRWGGDTNFMPVLAETRCIVEHLESSWELLRPRFDALSLSHQARGPRKEPR